MGQASAKLAGTPDTLQAIDDVCHAAEKASTSCGKHSFEVFQQAVTLRELRAGWVNSQQEAQDLHGQQVYAVAAALHALQTKLEWCKRKLHSRHLLSMRTFTAHQQAAHVLRVLGSAQEALMHFATAFKLQVLLSRQQQHIRHAVPEQQQADAAWGHQDAFYEAHAAGGGDASVAAAAATTPQQKPQQLQPQQAEEHEEGEEAADHEGGSPAQLTGGPAEQDIEAEASSPPPAQQSAARLAAQAAEGDEAQPDADTGADASGAALWEHSDEGWQDLLQRACRGELAAVLACARELVHGGDFCLQDFGLARQLLHTTVQQSCGTSCLWLGQLCERGLGMPAPDFVEAAGWYGRGAALGHLECAQALAFYYHHGLGVSQDIQAAFEWYEFAAEGGLAAAQNNLGQLLLQGPGGGSSAEHEAEAAVRLFQAAADQGSSAGWQNLGVCHELGFAGQGPDSHAAEACYRQAGTAKALLRLGQLLLQQRAHAAARRVLVSAAEAGSPEALLLLAKLHDAQQPGDCQYAQEQLGWSTALCSSGSGLASGSRGGVLGAHKAISTASLAAQASADVSLQLHKAAALAGAAESQHVVACSCWSRGQVQDAMQSWHAAAAQGYGPALLCLGALTETGSHGVHRDPPAARACYAKAAAAGSKQAAARLAVLDQDVALRTNNSWLQSS